MSASLSSECEVHFRRRGRGAPRELTAGAAPAIVAAAPDRVPRVSHLLALAIRLDTLVRTRQVKSYTDLARLGEVTTTRISQILSLVLLAPDIQEEVLFLPRIRRGRAPVILAQLLPIATTADWASQRRKWRAVRQSIRRRP
jgi:hypothetical protein